MNKPRMSRQQWVRLALVVLLAAAALAALVLLPVADYFTAFLSWLERLGPWGLVLLAAVYVPVCVLALPAWPLTMGAGFLFGVVRGVTAVSLGATLGATAAFLVGRTLARDLVAPRVAASPKFRAIDRAVAEQGFRIVFLLRLSPAVPYNVLNYGLGLTGIRLGSYMLASWLGMLPGTTMYVYLGASLKSLSDLASGRAQQNDLRYVLLAIGLLATIAVSVILARIATKAINEAVDDERSREISTSADGA